ncbi:neuropeptide FF receptor 2-like isoform X2 [Haliotis cracherodii]|uniref:neuropeptide FF receptor 2-like n=1 Tax=Haliotis rufescens TaxID=6454 RepID=UPI001EAFED36|nr:neuropeptide FF receptor 2-like [Haliotis rufescens]XP_048238667.1 neuropeptide FF receptor 2-like [Haliotis rufescens]
MEITTTVFIDDITTSSTTQNVLYSNVTSSYNYNYNNTVEVAYDADSFDAFDYPGGFKHVPSWEIALKTLTYIPVIAFAIVGNVLIILVVARNKRMQTTTNYYIVNLAAADLLVAVSCSWVHLVDDLTDGWVLGSFFCKFNTFAQVLSLVASIFTLTFISCDRFFGIVFAMKAHFIERRARYTIVALWVCSLAIAVPMLIYRVQEERAWRNHVEKWCDDDWPVVEWKDPVSNSTMSDIPARKIYYTIVCVVLFFLPCILMSAAYAVIIWTLWSAKVPGERISKDIRLQTQLKKRIILMLVLLLVTFIICWGPLVGILMYSEYREDKLSTLGPWYPKLEYFSRYLAHVNSAINPMIYAGFNDNFKKGFQLLFRSIERKNRYNTMVSRVDSFQSSTNITKV